MTKEDKKRKRYLFLTLFLAVVILMLILLLLFSPIRTKIKYIFIEGEKDNGRVYGKSCSEYNLKQEFRDVLGEDYIFKLKDSCEKFGGIWKEASDSVFCKLENEKINCDNAEYVKLKLQCNVLNALWGCKKAYFGCSCTQEDKQILSTKCDYRNGVCGGKCAVGSTCVDSGTKCFCKGVEVTSEPEPVEEPLKIPCEQAPAIGVEDWLKCLDYDCPEGKECMWQASLGRCGCQGKKECGYHYSEGDERCYGNCNTGECKEFFNENTGIYRCRCMDTQNQAIRCIETDNVDDIWTKGSCNDGNQNSDSCDGEFGIWLKEFFCSQEGGCSSNLIDCWQHEGSCYNGRCIPWGQDSDNDGRFDLDEYRYGTDPYDSSSYFEISPF